MYYDFKTPSVTPAVHKFGGASRFMEPRDVDRFRAKKKNAHVRSTSALEINKKTINDRFNYNESPR
jgi:hypothetical protein